jgi:hypothetical protein
MINKVFENLVLLNLLRTINSFKPTRKLIQLSHISKVMLLFSNTITIFLG